MIFVFLLYTFFANVKVDPPPSFVQLRGVPLFLRGCEDSPGNGRERPPVLQVSGVLPLPLYIDLAIELSGKLIKLVAVILNVMGPLVRGHQSSSF